MLLWNAKELKAWRKSMILTLKIHKRKKFLYVSFMYIEDKKLTYIWLIYDLYKMILLIKIMIILNKS